MIHKQLDLTYWKQVFSLTRLRQEAQGKPSTMQPTANIITSPYDIAVLEQLREEAFATLANVERVPTDIFVWSLGESERREATKIGGLPYWEYSEPWPVASSGNPMTFAAQICFTDSRDLTPSLPGDLLLIFIESVDWTEGWEAEPQYTFMWGMEDENSEVLFKWITLHERPLVTAQDIPEADWQLVPCYGTIHRTWDYPHVDGFAYPDVAIHIPTIFEATKIGGGCPRSNASWSAYTTGEVETYLCTLSSLAPASADFPFLNIPKTNDPQFVAWKHSKCEFLKIGDLGLINIFLASDGTVSWKVHDN